MYAMSREALHESLMKFCEVSRRTSTLCDRGPRLADEFKVVDELR